MTKSELIHHVLDELTGTYITMGDDYLPPEEKLVVLKDTIDSVVEDLGEELKHVYSTN